MILWNKKFNTDEHYEKWVKGGKKSPFYENEYSLIQKQIYSNDSTIQELGKRNMEKLAGYGYVPAILWLGNYYKNDDNYDLALKWYKLGANQKQDATCAYKCADLLVIMNGINNNHEAKKYYEIAVSENIAEAAYALGELQRRDNDIISALAAYKKASELGYKPAEDKFKTTEALISESILSFDELIKKITAIGITKEQVYNTYYKKNGQLTYGYCHDGKCTLSKCNDSCPIKVMDQTEKNCSREPKECIVKIEKALLGDPFVHDLWYQLGYWFECDSKISDAYKSYLKVIELMGSKKNIYTLYNLFRTSYKLKMYQKAGEWNSLYYHEKKYFLRSDPADDIKDIIDKSQYSIKSFVCNNCNSTESVKVWDKIIIDNDSELEGDLISGKLFHYKCSNCGKINTFDEPIYVKDFSKKHMIYYKKKEKPIKIPEGIKIEIDFSKPSEDPEVTFAVKQGLTVYNTSSLREIQEKFAILSTNTINIHIMDIIKNKYRQWLDPDKNEQMDLFFNFSKNKNYGIEQYVNNIPVSFLPISKNAYLNIHDKLINLVISNGYIPNIEDWEESFKENFKADLMILEHRGLFNTVLEAKAYSIPQDYDTSQMNYQNAGGSDSIVVKCVHTDEEKVEAYDDLQLPKYEGIYEELYSESKRLLEEGSIDSLKKALVSLETIGDYKDSLEQVAQCKDKLLSMLLENNY